MRDVLNHLLGEQRCAGGDPADEGDVDGRLTAVAQVECPRGPDPVGARTVRVAVEDTFALERHQLVGDRGGAREFHGCGYFPHRRRMAPPVDRLRDAADDRGLALRQLALSSPRARRAASTSMAAGIHSGASVQDQQIATLSRRPLQREHSFDFWAE